MTTSVLPVSDVLSPTTALQGIGNMVFEPGPMTDSEFATMLITAYQNHYDIRLPGFDPFLQENIPSIVSYQQNGTVEGTTIDVAPQTTDGDNMTGDVSELVADHPESTTVGISEVPDPSTYGVSIVSGVVDLLNDQPEDFLVQIFTTPVKEVDPYTNVLDESVSAISYRRDDNGWMYSYTNPYNDYSKMEDFSGVDENTVDNED